MIFYADIYPRRIQKNKIKILFVGQHKHPESAERGVIRELRRECEVKTFDYINSYKFFGKDLQPSPLGNLLVKKINHDLYKLAEKYRPDILFVAKGHYVRPETIFQIKEELSPKTIFWMPDDPQLFEQISHKVAYAYDYVLTSSEQCIPMYKDLGVKKVEYTPFFCDPSIHKKLSLDRISKEKYGADVCFIGSYYPERGRLINKIKNIHIKIWGPGWKYHFKSKNKKIKIMGDWADQTTIVKAFNSSKIVLNIHHVQMKYGGMKANSRVFEATGCKAFHLTDKTFGLEDLFECNKEISCYQSSAELTELLKYYLDSEEERDIIAERGQNRTYKDYTVINMAKKIIKLCRL